MLPHNYPTHHIIHLIYTYLSHPPSNRQTSHPTPSRKAANTQQGALDGSNLLPKARGFVHAVIVLVASSRLSNWWCVVFLAAAVVVFVFVVVGGGGAADAAVQDVVVCVGGAHAKVEAVEVGLAVGDAV